MRKVSTKIIKNIVLIITIMLMAILFGTNISEAATWNGSATGGMPSFGSFNPTTGLFPQVLSSKKTITLDEARLNPTTLKWNAYYTSGMVYCANNGKILRNGKFDPTTYYIENVGSTYNNTVNSIKSSWQSTIEKNYYRNASIRDVHVYVYENSSLETGFNRDAFVVSALASNSEGIPTDAKTEITQKISDINNMLAGSEKPTVYSADVDSVKTYGEYNGSATQGPEVCVMETSEGAGNGYKLSVTKTYTNSAEAYVLTALEDAYKKDENGNIITNYPNKYTEEDIQTAYWLLVDHDGINTSKLTANGRELYRKATEEYAKFLETMQKQNGYSASIDSNSAQVIVNRDTKEYIVGPFKLYYPDYTDISYVKSLSITTNTGRTLVVDKDSQGFELICQSGGTLASNGMYTETNKKMYPKSGEGFFIKFSAEAANFPTKISLNANFEYINNTTMQYNELRSTANIYQYIGHVETNDGRYAMLKGTVTFTAKVDYEQNEKKTGYKDVTKHEHANIPHTVYLADYSCCNGGIYTTEKVAYTYWEYVKKQDTLSYPNGTLTLYQPYVKMEEKPVSTDVAQPLIATLDGSREYAVAKASKEIDLTMELGGKVFLDSTGGKESIANGIYEKEQDKPMSNVVVTLYRADGTKIGTTKTDNNGNYKFTNLNAMYQYYVKFTYNGQYYEPTTYSGTSTWGRANWENNSNGTDKRQERISYNARFKTISSSPANYETTVKYDSATTWLVKGSDGKVYNKTYSKNDLLGLTLNTEGKYTQTNYAVIDEFGNLYSDGKQVRGKDGKYVNIEEIKTTEVKNELKSMVQYVKDSLMDSYTYKPQDMNNSQNTNGTMDLYPVYSIFVIDDSPVVNRSLLGWNINVLYNTAYHINQGYSERQKADLALKKDIEKVTLEINGQTHTYTYDTLENKENADGTWDISVRLSDAYYNTNYSRELYKSDYLYKVSNYGEDFAKYGKSKSDELEVYVTYKIMIRNQAMSIKAKVEELVDYYDKDYEYIDERSYIEIKSGDNKGIYETKASETSRYENIAASTKTTLDGYNNVYIQGLNDKYLSAGQTAYVYLTFKVKKDVMNNEEWVKLDEDIATGNTIGVGKENIVEINGYSTKYANGTRIPNAGTVGNTGKEEIDNAGLIDRDSNPGNLNPVDVPKDGTIKYENFEDDTDKAPNIRLRLYRDDEANRVISGVVWEDERNETIDATTTGDGIRTDKETLINGVTVQLVELMDNGEEFIWRTFENGSGTADKTSPIINANVNGVTLVDDYKFAEKHDGAYAFKSFMPGKYVVRFIYGDTVKTVLTKDANTSVNKTLGKTGLNDKSYNGQDYKSTTYQEGITQNKTYAWREPSTWKNGQETLGKILTEISTFKADASNNETANAKLNELKAYLYDITASDKVNNVSDAKDIESRRNEVINYSDDNAINHIAEVLASFRELPEYLGTSYNQTQLQSLIDELMAQTKMRAETGVIVVEFEYDRTGTGNQVVNNKASYAINNVDLGLEERPKAQLAIDKEVTNVKLTLADGSILFDAKNTATNVLWRDHKSYEVGYKGNFMDPNKFGNIVNIRNNNASKFGLIQLSMDEELMHGATIEVTYKVTVSNIGEVDYKDNLFYYTGNVSDKSKVVRTRADQVIDYVANNLQFNVQNNQDWKVISKDNILSQGLVNTALDRELEKYNTIIITDKLSTNLIPNRYKTEENKNAQDSISVPLVLTQLITSENETDDLTYRNIVEIVKTGNTVGRRMEYSVVGNQDPIKEPQELDSDKAEVVKILPPFGNAGLYIIIAIVTIAAVGIIITGVIFIKKKILTK